MSDEKSSTGFEELTHTADWAMRVWAPTLEELFVQAAKGMNALSGARLVRGRRVKRTFTAESADEESLLVIFLSELIYLAEQENLGFTKFAMRISKSRIGVKMEGAPLESLNKAIKAVTYHNLNIRQTAQGCEVEIVFDV